MSAGRFLHFEMACNHLCARLTPPPPRRGLGLHRHFRSHFILVPRHADKELFQIHQLVLSFSRCLGKAVSEGELRNYEEMQLNVGDGGDRWSSVRLPGVRL
jgi:hypothetical protein